MIIENKVIGERLKMYRNALNIPQGTLAEKLNVAQTPISRFENGLGGSLEVFFQLLGFYSDHFLISYLFQKEFVIVKKSEALDDLHIIAVERLKELKKDLSGVIDLIESAN